MFWEQPVHFASQSDVGLRRENNEDSAVVRLAQDEESFREHGHLFVVADGMGGHAVGELASKLAVETIPLAFLKSNGSPRAESLRAAVVEANRVIHERGSANFDFRRMGTTCSSLLLSPDGVLVAHVGDSRVYRVRDHRIDQLTFDHSLQWELRRQGGLKTDDSRMIEARNVITRSLGPEARVEVDVEGPFAVAAGDAFVLCSDGLTAHVQDAEIGAAVRYLPPERACRLLVDLALVRGGSDNVTVVVVGVGGDTPSEVSETQVDRVSRVRRRTRVGQVVAGCLLAAGLLLATVGRDLDAGSIVGVLGVATGVVSLLAGRRAEEHRRHEGEPAADGDTVVWRPHASDSAQLSERFLGELQALRDELARAGREEEWEIDWEQYERGVARCAEAMESRQHARALAALAKSLDELVAGITAHRNRAQREARWGKTKSESD